MMRRIILISAAIVFGLTACTNRLDDYSGALRIGLRADIASVQVSTRTSAAPYQGTTPSTSSVLDASVWISDDVSGDIVSFSNTGTPGNLAKLPLHTEIQFNSSGLVYPVNDVLLYPETGTVYCIGLYPYSSDAWVNEDSLGATSMSHASRTITGADDLMFAPKVGGSQAAPISTPLAFSHQLTWIKINVIAESLDAIATWGNIDYLTIISPFDRLTLDLNSFTGSPSYNGSSTNITTYSGSTPLSITLQELGSVFCAPATSYNISVTTANLGAKNIMVGLKGLDGTTPVGSADDAKGKMFVITLRFNKTNIIDASCELVPWDDDNETLRGTPNAVS